MPRPLIIYFKDAMYFDHARRVYIAARTKKRASEISGFTVQNFDSRWCKQAEAGSPEAPTFIQEEGVWLEIRDHDEEGHLEAAAEYYGPKDRKYKAPANEAAFIRAGTLEACREAFTLLLDRALRAHGIPREEL